MSNLIFETMLREAEIVAAKAMKRGASLDEALDTAAKFVGLNEAETEELAHRVKKTPSAKPVAEDDADMADIVGDMDDDASEGSDSPENSIFFSSPDELDTAQGVLMYKGIPWSMKGEDYLSFENSTLVTQAHEALKRRWDFVNNEQRTVAVIEFDNITDYEKVLDFIASKNMTVLKGDEADLAQDVDIEISEAESAHKKAKKDAKEQGLPAPVAPAHSMSYKALHKDKLTDVSALDPSYDTSARSVRVVKRWK